MSQQQIRTISDRLKALGSAQRDWERETLKRPVVEENDAPIDEADIEPEESEE